MPRRARILDPGSGSGGGPPPTVPNLAIGPDMGGYAGTQNTTWKVGVEASGDAAFPMAFEFGNEEGVGVEASGDASFPMDIAFDFGAEGVGVHQSGTVVAAPFWQAVETATESGAAATSITIPIPASTQAGDLLLAFVGWRGISGVGGGVSTPSGWNLLGSVGADVSLSASAYYKIADGSEGSSVVFDVSDLAGANGVVGEIHRIIAFDSADPIDVFAFDVVEASDLDPDPDSPSFTTTVTNTRVFAFLLHDHAALSQTHTPAASHVERTDFQVTVVGLVLGVHSMDRVFAATGATGTAEHNCTETTGTEGIMLRVAIAPGTLVIAP